MKIKDFSISILLTSLFYVNFAYSSNFDLKKKEDINKLMDIIKSTEQKINFDEKINVLAFVIREIDFKKACPCVKKVFFKSLNELCDLILDSNSSDLHKLESFLQSLYKRDLISSVYKKQIDAVRWLLNGGIGTVPNFIKQQVIKKYQKKYDIDIFAEVGSCHPGMLISHSNQFKSIYAIGFDKITSKHANDRLKMFKNIQLIPGAVERNFSTFVKQTNAPSILWISSKDLETVKYELGLIVKSKAEVIILIDNASCFSDDEINELIRFVNKAKSSVEITVEYNIIIIK